LNLESSDSLEGNLPAWVQVTFDDTPADGGEQIINAGATITYSLRATAGSGFQYIDTIIVKVLSDKTPATSTSYLSDLDSDVGEQVVILQDASGRQDLSDVKLIWSDISSTTDHSSSFDDVGATPTSSSDWINGNLLKNFPLITRVLCPERRER
jgi:hypothetical protein